MTERKTINVLGKTYPVLAETYGHTIAAHPNGPAIVTGDVIQTLDSAVLGDDLSLLDRAMILEAYRNLTWPLLVASLN